jgi:hypothetical protein
VRSIACNFSKAATALQQIKIEHSYETVKPISCISSDRHTYTGETLQPLQPRALGFLNNVFSLDEQNNWFRLRSRAIGGAGRFKSVATQRL